MSLTIRPAEPRDYASIVTMLQELAAYEQRMADMTASAEDIGRALSGDLVRAGCDIAEWQGESAGFALWFYSFASFKGHINLYLEDLYVRQKFRRLGIGKKLLSQLAHRCVEVGAGRLEWSVFEWNSLGLDFYKAQGAVVLEDVRKARLSGQALLDLAAQGRA